MDNKVIAFFDEHNSAEEAIGELRSSGFSDNEISLVAKDDQGGDDSGYDNQNLADGTITGGAIGGLAGLAIGAGALLIPGIGPIIAAGPLGGVLTGALTGGVAGGLIDYGIPEERSQYYEEQIQAGRLLVVLEADEEKVNEASEILRNNGAQEIEVH